MKILILGAGVLGTMTAYYLQKAGHEVEVVDSASDVAQGASYANGGIVHASEVMPWSQPGMPRKILSWLGNESAPVLVRYSAIPRIWRWGFHFLKNCSDHRFRNNTLANLRLALHSQQCFKEVRQELNLDYDLNTNGALKIFRKNESLDNAVSFNESMREFGMNSRALTPSECLKIEPALGESSEFLAGGIFFPDDEVGDSYKFTRGVANYCKRNGTVFRLNTDIVRLEHSQGKIERAITTRGSFSADRYVVALGAQSPFLLRPLKIHVPIYPVKGVSITFPSDLWPNPARMATIDDELVYALVPLGNRVRIVGSAEITNYDTTPDETRCAAIVKNALSVFPDLKEPFNKAKPTLWAGLRPVTPTGTPLLGETPIPNLFLNTGHCHQGWTLSCGSAQIVADIVNEQSPKINLEHLGLNS